MKNTIQNKWTSGAFLLGVVASMFVAPYAYATELGGTLKSESSYQIPTSEWQRHDWQLDIEINTELGGGDLTGIARFLVDGESKLNSRETPDTYSSLSSVRFDDRHGQADTRELYWEYYSDSAYWKLGKQQVVWGEADGLKLLDVVNPQSFREFILDDFDDSRIPLWMVNAEFNIGEDSILQVLWIPDTSTHELAPIGSPYEFTSELIVPQALPGVEVNLGRRDAPSKLIEDSDIGFRLSHYQSGWDLTLNYLYRFVDEPVLKANLDGTTVDITQEFKRSHLIGGSASNAFGDWTLRAELAYETNRFHRSSNPLPGVIQANQWGSVIGLDFQGWTDQFVSLQWFQTRILSSADSLIESKTEDTLTLLWESNFLNETLTFRWLNLYSLDRHDGVSRPKVTYNLQSNLDISFGYDRFYGTETGLYGQFDRADRINIGFEWGFE